MGKAYDPASSITAIDRFRATLSAPGSTLTASMLRDLESGGPIEADHIVGFMLERARVHGLDEGMLVVAYAHLKVYEGWRGSNQPNFLSPQIVQR